MNAESLEMKKKILGDLANGTLWTNWKTGNNPRSPKSGLNWSMTAKKAIK